MNARITALAATVVLASAAFGGQAGAAQQGVRTGHKGQVVCQTVPVPVGGVSILGKRVPQVSDLKVCTTVDANTDGTPKIVNQDDCGAPCFTVEIENLDIAADTMVDITYKIDGVPATPIHYDPEPIGVAPSTGRVCVVGVGTPDPCIDRITNPANLSAKARRGGRIALMWTASKDYGGAPLAGYEVWRSDTGDDGTFTLLTSVPTTEHMDQGLLVGDDYHYYVVALDGDGNRSGASNLAAAIAR